MGHYSQAVNTESAMLEVEQVSFAYGRRTALEQVSFAVPASGFTALLGPNGAGKTTLFSLITRLFALQQGQICIAGQAIDRNPAAALQQIGVVFQQSTLDLDLTVAQNLHYHGALHGLPRIHRKARIERELARMQMLDRLHDKVRSLNGGHRRRVEIARALLHRPRLLLLDEPTVGLDTRSRKALNQHVRELCQQDGLGVLWATHLIEEITAEDSVVILHQGRVQASASAFAICTQQDSPNLTDAFERLTGTTAPTEETSL